MAETIHLRGEGGAVIAMDLPLPEGIAERYERGQLVRVHSDGSPYYAPPSRPSTAVSTPGQGSALTGGTVPRPGARASKEDWVLWAAAVHGLTAEAAEAMTKAQLQDLPEQSQGSTTGAAGGGMPGEDAPKPDWIDYIVKSGRLSREDAEAYTKDDLIAMVS